MEPMRKLQQYFVPYTGKEDFFEKLLNVVNLAIDNNSIDHYSFQMNIERKIWPFLSQTKFFIIEDTYTETEWKDMIAAHYVHTKYITKPTVIRVHLFNGEQDIAQSYLGCFTLRKINNADMILSFIYPNWNVLRLEKGDFENSYLITATKRIHIFAEELEIKTTPYFVQDGMVASCAHASILMMTHFLNLKFGYKKIRIKDVNQSYLSREKMFPTRGLLPEQVMEVLTNNEINVVEYELGFNSPSDEEKRDIKRHIIAYLRSGMPIMLGMDGHGVLIVGFKENEDEFLFLDDSGALIHNINKEKYKDCSQEYDCFISSCSWDYIFDYVKDSPKGLVQFLMPIHERIYVDYDDVSYRCSVLEEKIMLNDGVEETAYDIGKKRLFIADNVECKKFINENILDRETSGELLDEFICREQSHYLWCYEFEYEGEIFIIFINTTYNIESDENNIYINRECEPFHVAKHFHTVDMIKTIDCTDLPLFDKRRLAGKSITNVTKERVGSKRPHIPKEDAKGELSKTQESQDDTSEKKQKKKKKRRPS